MTFIQAITIVTDQIEAVEDQLDRWIAATAGQRTARRVVLAADRDHANAYVAIVEFPSYEAAMENSRLADTNEFANQMTRLCSVPPTFHNLDVRRVEERISSSCTRLR